MHSIIIIILKNCTRFCNEARYLPFFNEDTNHVYPLAIESDSDGELRSKVCEKAIFSYLKKISGGEGKVLLPPLACAVRSSA